MTAITACHDLARSQRPGRGSPLALARRWPGPGISLPSDCREMIRRGALVAMADAGVPLPTIAAAMGHVNLQTTAIYTTAAGLEARDFLARMWDQKADSAGYGT